MAKKKNNPVESLSKKAPTLSKIVTTPIDYSFWKNNSLRAVILFLLAGVLYFQGIHYGYVLDDAIVIEDNEFTSKGVSGIWDIMTNESMTGYFGEQKNLVQGNRYRPLSLVTFATEVSLFGKNPTAHHIVNIIIYGLTCMILFWTLFLLLFQRDKRKNSWLGLAFLASLIYTIHPIHTEAVANIKGRDEIMALLFSLLTLISTIKYINNKKKKYLLIGGLSIFLGLLSKENAITFLAIIPASMYFFTAAQKRDYIKVLLSLIISFVVYLVLRFTVSGVPNFGAVITDVMNNPFYGMTTAQKYATISFTLLKYLGLSFFPLKLSHDYYPYAIPILHWGDYRAILGLLVYASLVIYVLRSWKSKSITSYSIIFYLAALSIVSNIVINVGTFMNERFIFISTVGTCLFTAYFLRDILGKWKAPTGKYMGYSLLSLVLIGYTYKTTTRIPDWESALTLNESAVKVSPNSARANSFMSTALYNDARETSDREEKARKLIAAENYAAKAVSLIPKYKNANLMRAGIAGEKHKLDNDLPALLKTFKEVASNRPDIPYVIEYMDYLSGSRITDDELINFYHDVGYNELLQKRADARWALHYLSKAYAITKSNAMLNRAIGDAYATMGDTKNANEFFKSLTK